MRLRKCVWAWNTPLQMGKNAKNDIQWLPIALWLWKLWESQMFRVMVEKVTKHQIGPPWYHWNFLEVHPLGTPKFGAKLWRAIRCFFSLVLQSLALKFGTLSGKRKKWLFFSSKLLALQSSTPKFGALSQKKKKQNNLNFGSKLSALQSLVWLLHLKN